MTLVFIHCPLSLTKLRQDQSSKTFLVQFKLWTRKIGPKQRRHDIQHNDTQHNDTKHNETLHNDTQHNDNQHNDIQNKIQ